MLSKHTAWRRWLLLVSMMTAAVGITAEGNAGEIDLRIHHASGAESMLHRDILLPWADAISLDSGGRMEVVVLPAMQGGGSPVDLYRQVQDGVVDIVAMPIDYAAGEFVRTRVFELPTVHSLSPRNTTLAMNKIFDSLAEDYSGVKVLMMYAGAGNVLHMRRSVVDVPAKLTGTTIRGFSQSANWLIESWGATASKVAGRNVPDALLTGEIDGVLLPFGTSVPFRIPQTVRYSHFGANGWRFGTTAFVVLMNLNVFNSLPLPLQELIEDTSNKILRNDVVTALRRNETMGRAAFTDARIGMVQLNQRRINQFNAAAGKAVQKWLDYADESGIDGAALLQLARESVKQVEN